MECVIVGTGSEFDGACRFQEWEDKGLFKALWQAGLEEYDEVKRIERHWQSVDGAMTKVPFAGAANGANPTDRGKRGTKRSLLTDEAGMPLALVVGWMEPIGMT